MKLRLSLKFTVFIDEIEKINRTCQGQFPNHLTWMRNKERCSFQVLEGGREDFCFCSQNYCNEDYTNISSVCVMESSTTSKLLSSSVTNASYAKIIRINYILLSTLNGLLSYTFSLL